MDATSARIAAAHLTKRFESTAAIDDVSFDVAPGEFVTLVGPSGCGKSTTLRIVAGLVRATSGTVRVDGEDVRAPIRRAAMVFQSPVLFPWRTVLDNVLLPVDVQRLTLLSFALTALIGALGILLLIRHRRAGGTA